MPDINNLINSLAAGIPDLADAFVRGAQYAIGAFVLVGIVYVLRRYL
jgi:hypothetical protein